MKSRDRLRQLIAQEAARLMYEEQIREYRTAKRKAARRFGPEQSLSLGNHLPSNAEIRQELMRLLDLHEEQLRPERLLQLRLLALKYLELMAPFRPYLVGSVLSGCVTERSDIDIHLFAESPEDVAGFLGAEGIPFEEKLVTVRQGGKYLDYIHFYLEDQGIEIECSIYTPKERHRVPRSSITGQPMERADAKKLRRLIASGLTPPVSGSQKG
jgi:predicted nucleotidyltransferase